MQPRANYLTKEVDLKRYAEDWAHVQKALAGDMESRNWLWEKIQPPLWLVIKKYCRGHDHLEKEARSEAWLAVEKAMTTYRPITHFHTFAWYQIRSDIYHLTARYHQVVTRPKASAREQPTTAMQESVWPISPPSRFFSSDLSLDGPMETLSSGEKQASSFLDNLLVEEPKFSWETDRAIFMRHALKKNLNLQQHYLLTSYYGLDENEPKNLREIALVLKVTSQRCQQIHQRALRVLRKVIEEYEGRQNVGDIKGILKEAYEAGLIKESRAEESVALEPKTAKKSRSKKEKKV